MTGDQIKIWDFTVAELEKAKLLRAVDGSALYSYCVLFGELVAINRRIDEEGLVVEDAKGSVKKHPLVTIRNQHLEKLSRLRAELGFSPTSRVGLGRSGDARQGSLFGPTSDPEMFGLRVAN